MNTFHSKCESSRLEFALRSPARVARQRYLQVRYYGSAKSNLIPSATDVAVLLCNICKALITRCMLRTGCPFPSFSIRTSSWLHTEREREKERERESRNYQISPFNYKFHDKFRVDFHRINN